jgi:hypothetical protein
MTTYPTSIDTPQTVTALTPMDSPAGHAALHNLIASAIVAIETLIGVTGAFNFAPAGGGGSFPDFTGSGSPEGVQTANFGQWYQDTAGSGPGTSGLYVFGGTDGTNTGWILVGGTGPSTPIGGLATPFGNSFPILYGGPGGGVLITDTDARSPGGSGNALFWVAAGDGNQFVEIQLGAPGSPMFYTFSIATTTIPGTLVAPNMPTSPALLSPGSLWNNGGVVNIV